MDGISTELQDLLDEVAELDDLERGQYLIELSDEFSEVPDRLAVRPFPESHRVPRCESEAYVWAEDRPDGTLDFHFAVENPHGISARALSVALGETLSGKPLDQVAVVSEDVVPLLFGRELSMGKAQGLGGIVNRVVGEARQRLKQRAQA